LTDKQLKNDIIRITILKVKLLISKTIRHFWIFNLALLSLVFQFTTGCKTDVSMVTDIDGNSYQTIKIGTQIWMAENLKTTKYNDGISIPLIRDSIAWSAATYPGYCFYKNDSIKNKNIYGTLYNWYAVKTGKLAPKGWHIPTDEEFTILINYVSAKYNTTCSVAKALAINTSWASDTSKCSIGNDPTKNNGSGFSAIAGGIRYILPNSFSNLNNSGNWWSSTQVVSGYAWRMSLFYNFGDVGRGNEFVQNGLSVRCVKD